MIVNMVNYLHLFSPIISLGINAICQVCVVRYINKFSLLKSIFLGFGFGLWILLLVEMYYLVKLESSLLEKACSLSANIVAYIALGYCYFHFINLGETARRIRIIRELYESNDGLSLDELLARYNAKEIIERRLSRLINNRQIILKDGRYYIANLTMLFITKIIVGMKLVILGKRSEFD